MRATSLAVLLCFAPIGLWGYAYEKAYYKALGTDIPEGYGVYHFVVAGFLPLAFLLAIVVAFFAITALFIKIDTFGDGENTLESMLANAKLRANPDFAYAKVIAIFCFLYPFAVYYWEYFMETNRNPGVLYLYILWVALGAFAWPVLVSPVHQKAQIALLMICSIIALFVAGGFHDAKNDAKKAEAVIRDDVLVKITRENEMYSSEVKQIKDLFIMNNFK